MDSYSQQPSQPLPSEALAKERESLASQAASQGTTLQPQPPQPKNWVLIIALAIVTALIASAATYFAVSSQKQTPPQLSTISEPPSPTPLPKTDETENWKTFTTPKFTFRAPPATTIEERETNFFIVNPYPNIQAPNAGIAIDARLQGTYANYENAINSAKDNLTEETIKNIKGGVRISGKVGPGFGEGTKMEIAIFNYYDKGAISIESPLTNIDVLLFDQILSTFKFTDQNADSKSSKYSELIQKAQNNGSVRIIVSLNIPWQPEGNLPNTEAIQAQRNAIVQAQDNLLKAMSAYKVTSITKFDFVPSIALDIDLEGLMYLISSPLVNSIEEDKLLAPGS